jgi:hypothetical protein
MIFIDPHTDLLHVLQFINDFSKTIGIKALSIDTQRISGIINGAVFDGDYASEKASPFKKIAAFVAYFVATRPILSPLPLEKFKNIENHQNAIFSLEIAIDSLHGAKINRSDGEFTLKDRIELSNHSYIDIIDAIAGVTPQNGKKLIAVLLEQMCYRRNPACEYIS